MEFLKEPGQKVLNSKVEKVRLGYLMFIVAELYSQFQDKEKKRVIMYIPLQPVLDNLSS